MAESNKKLSKTIRSRGARHLSIDAGLIYAYMADAMNVMEREEVKDLLRRSQINPQSFEASGARIPYENVSKVFNRFRAFMRDEDIGRFERPVPLGYFRLMMLAVINTDSLIDALERIAEYRNVATEALKHSVSLEGNQVVCEVAQQPGQKVVSHGALDFYLSGIVRILSWLGNRTLVPTIVRLSFPPPSYLDEYRFLYYGASVLFRQSTNSISFDRESLSGKAAQTEGSLHKYLRQAPRDLFFPRYMAGNTTEAVREKVREHLIGTCQAPTLESVAETLNCGPQTLRRRLQDDGTNFHDIKLQVRRDMAIHLLIRGGASVESIAEAVGYTESSNFVRAFKEWTNMTPRQFRKRV